MADPVTPAPASKPAVTPYMALNAYATKLENEIATLWTGNHMVAAFVAGFFVGAILMLVL